MPRKVGGGGMIQVQLDDGTWKNCFQVEYKSVRAVYRLVEKYRTHARIVRKDGTVVFDTRRDVK